VLDPEYLGELRSNHWFVLLGSQTLGIGADSGVDVRAIRERKLR
jgi:hypothetical protein